ncbi:PcfJ domain-containing protein [Lederbergia sp. NSJ-179]|uniref:PcfJ domain-containing protein n=1 Tax=Lederbergia sp. NSJ-179 TaxID=2931402 RepID=UPI001FD5A633|nr:PcfJ domain-containing protein [Lederbergia sp. NSJ-179]MCJ7839960.1 PcfJ domain-containing protein [Lederbergia sp. NSJ-179]
MQGSDPRFLAHFPDQISQKLIDFIKDTVFFDHRYVIIQSTAGGQRGYCTHCKKDFHIQRSDKLKHNDKWICQNCGSPVTAKHAGRGRKNLFTDAYVVWYEKSKVNPEAIVAMGLHVILDFADYRNVQPAFRVISYYIFEPGYSEQIVYNAWRDKWFKTKRIRTESTNSMQHKQTFISYDNVREVVKNTPYQYTTWESYRGTYDRKDLVHFFELASKYECIEYLTKLGFHKCVEAKLTGSRTYGVINWKGKSLEKVTRLSKSELKQLRKENVEADPATLDAYHKMKKAGFLLTFAQAEKFGTYNFIESAVRLGEPLNVLAKYTLKQMDKNVIRSPYSILSDLRDYWSEARELGLDLSKGSVKWPNDLQEAHIETTRRMKVKVDERLNKQIAKRLPELNRFSFSKGGLLIRPAASSIELFEEGKILHHCVGQYTERYAEGDTDIYVVRKTTEADIPFFTVEIQDTQIIQCRGYRNREMTKEVAAFMEAFKEERLTKRKKKLSA